MKDKITSKIRFGIETDNDLILSTVRIPFGNKLGALLNITGHSDITSSFVNLTTMPGVMSLNLSPTIGRNNTALNTYMAKLYAKLIRKISGAKDIEKPDQFMYLEMGKTCVDIVCKLKTIYELAFVYKEYNLYWPKAMIKALGVDPDSIATNLEDYRAWVNRVISRLRSFNWPNISYLKSGWDYGRTILVDSPDLPRAQAYMFNMRTAYSWDPLSDPNGTKLVTVDLGGFSAGMVFTTYAAFIDGIIDSFAYDQDFIDISAWYSNLYADNPDGLLKFTDCTQTMEHVQVVYDIEALTVIENSEILPYTANLNTTLDIYQMNNEVYQNMAFDISAAGITAEKNNINAVQPHICNCHKTKPSDKDIAKYMTFKYSYGISLSGRDGGFPTSAVMFIAATNDYSVLTVETISMNANHQLQMDYYPDIMRANGIQDQFVSEYSQFNHKPIKLIGEYTISAGQYIAFGDGKYVHWYTISDFDNYVEVTNAILANYHSAVWYTNLEDK